MKPRLPRILAWDLECSSLKANWGIILCGGYKIIGTKGQPKVISLADVGTCCPTCERYPVDDKPLLEVLGPILADCDAWVTWYGKRFDSRFINSRLLYHGLPTLPPVPHIDGWETAKYQLALHSNRLASVQEFLELPDAKTPIRGPEWTKALAGDRRALKYVIDHCKADVLVLEEAYLRLLPLIKGHPHQGLGFGEDLKCQNCGSTNLEKRGFALARTRKYQRFQCKQCGAWGRGTKAVELAKVVGI